MEPKRTISNKPVSGKKQSKDRNLSKTSLPVEYYWNSTAWMQVSIWNDWIPLRHNIENCSFKIVSRLLTFNN
ncbi:hypothetical protein RCL_jg24272.t1 [Rhizophagus clarus]|uniref:DDE-1 domain-containing protein n=1 Tax=Rhizophagus clarus TaxID=94130 RepID=A0A8H3MB18_9GLOM|nr:hypothetical protein RCL_jg24272.t1 [Rhizophagus clarus]